MAPLSAPSPSFHTSTPTTISSYTILPLTLPLLPSFQTPSTHHLYIRAHAPKQPDVRTPRSLFIANVPIDATLAHFRALFAPGGAAGIGGGTVERVQFLGRRSESDTTQGDADADAEAAGGDGAVANDTTRNGDSAALVSRKRKRGQKADQGSMQRRLADAARLPELWDRELGRSGAAAVVLFVDEASAQAALRAVRRAAKEGRRVVWGEGTEGKVPPLGSARYLTHHRLTYPDPQDLQARVDTYMTLYNAHEAATARSLTRQRNVPDEEGFVTVTSSSSRRVGPAPSLNAQNLDALPEELRRKLARQREKSEGMRDFYRFQHRERRKEGQREVVRRFEEDRRRVERMRGGRRVRVME